MEPRLGDIVLNRYVLVSLLRNEAGLQVWQANDHILTQDCQLFIVRNSHFLPEVNVIASTLALSHNRRFTQVLQLQHHDAVAIIITALDRGVTINDYLARKDAPLSYEAIRTIVAETAQALSKLLASNITHHAVSSDTVRISSSGIELADTPVSPLLEDITQLRDDNHPIAKQSIEHTATRQLASLLYTLLTRTSSRVQAHFDASLLPDNTPSEFRMICTRSLAAHENSNIVPMASIAELMALLGSYTPLSQLTQQDIEFNGKTSVASISNVHLKSAEDSEILPLPEDFTQTEEQFNEQLLQRAEQNVNNLSSASSLNTLARESNKSTKFGKGFKNAGRTLGSLLKHGNAHADAQNSDADSLNDDGNTSTDIDFHDIAAAEMANILAPTELDTDDVIFPTLSASYKHFPDSATSRNVLEQTANKQNKEIKNTTNKASVIGSFDFENLLAENTQHTELMTRPKNLISEGESTGRVPVVDTHGRFIAPGEESARALRDEINSRQSEDQPVNNTPSLPPSFQPLEQAAALHKQKQNNQSNNGTIADAKIWWGLSTKVIAIGAVSLLLIAGLALALHGLFGTHESADNFGNNGSWDSTNLENVPFGSQGILPQEKQPAKKHIGRKQVRAVPKPKVPTNTVAYQADRYQFLSFPAQQPGYGYYIHLTEPQAVYRFVISIRTSGGHAYLLANTKNDPTKGTQVAEFTFDESGTTDVKLTKIVKSQDFMLWVPKDSMPKNSLYINSVKLY